MALFPVDREAVQFDVAQPAGDYPFMAGLKRTPYGVAATFETTVSHRVQGIAVDAEGAVLVKIVDEMPNTTVWVSGLPVDRNTGQVLCTTDPAVVHSNGLPFAANGLLCIDPLTPAIAWNFLNTETLSPIWTFDRPGSAWVMDLSGIYVERGPNVPRFQWTPDGRSEGLLVERQATNLFPYAANVGNLANNQGITSTQVDDPMFPWQVSHIKQDTSIGEHVAQHITGGLQDTPKAVSFIAKPTGNQRYLAFGRNSATAASNTVFLDTETGLIDTQLGEDWGRITSLPGGWWYCILLFDRWHTSGGLGRPTISLMSGMSAGDRVFQGDGESGALVAYIGIEEGLTASSPIYTDGLPVTRPADTLYADMSLLPEFDPTKGTIVLEAKSLEAAGQIVSLDDTITSATNRLLMTRASSGDIRFLFRAQSEDAPYVWAAIPEFDVYRLAIAYDSHSARIRFNGGSTVHATTPTANAIQGLRYLRLYNDGHGLIRHVRYIPQAVSDAQLQQLSSLS